MYKRILVPIDGSATAQAGLLEAIGLAKDQHAALRLLHVVEESVLAQTAGLDGTAFYITELLNGLIAAGKEVTAAGLALAKSHGMEADSAVVERFFGRSADCIIDYAVQWPADLIVMGTHGRRGINRLVMGSDAEIVVRTTPVPILLVRTAEDDSARSKGTAPARAPG